MYIQLSEASGQLALSRCVICRDFRGDNARAETVYFRRDYYAAVWSSRAAAADRRRTYAECVFLGGGVVRYSLPDLRALRGRCASLSLEIWNGRHKPRSENVFIIASNLCATVNICLARTIKRSLPTTTKSRARARVYDR